MRCLEVQPFLFIQITGLPSYQTSLRDACFKEVSLLVYGASTMKWPRW